MGINQAYDMVKNFHKAFGHPIAEIPTWLSFERAKNRYDWIFEEICELMTATTNGDIYEQADAFIDVIYFALGGLVEMGIPPEKIFNIVQEANMNKLWEDGKPRYRADGKVIKPPHWKDPHDEIVETIENMGWK